jgi:hypothetical protein
VSILLLPTPLIPFTPTLFLRGSTLSLRWRLQMPHWRWCSPLTAPSPRRAASSPSTTILAATSRTPRILIVTYDHLSSERACQRRRMVLPAQCRPCPCLATSSPSSHARLPPALPLLLHRRRRLGPSHTATIVGDLTLLLKMDMTMVKSRCFVYIFHLFQLSVSLVADFIHFSRISILIFACPSL